MTDSTRTATPSFPPLPPRAALRWDVVRRSIRDLAPRSVLEIGCGQGAMGARVAATVPSYHAVEPDPASCAVARDRVVAHGGTVTLGDHTAGPIGPFDLVLACEVLEHIDDHEAALADWVQLVRPGGHLLLSVPAWPERFAPTDIRSGHYRRYSPSDLADVMTRAGLETPRTTLYAWPLGYALELVRNRLDSRFLARAQARGASTNIDDLTAASGRLMQPRRRGVGVLVQTATTPFSLLQRLAPTRGTGLVSIARRV